jgi:hypothetical protein
MFIGVLIECKVEKCFHISHLDIDALYVYILTSIYNNFKLGCVLRQPSSVDISLNWPWRFEPVDNFSCSSRGPTELQLHSHIDNMTFSATFTSSETNLV